MMLDSPQIELFQERHLDRTARLITNSFLQMNPIWRQSKSQFDQTFNAIRKKILPCCGTTHSYVLVLNDEVISSSIQLDYVDYASLPPTPSITSSLLLTLGKYATEIDKHILPRQGGNIKRGEVVYGLYGVIDPKYASKGYAMRFWVQQFAFGKTLGWKAFYTRMSNEASYRMMTALGVQTVAKTRVEAFQGEHNIYLGRLDLTSKNSLGRMMKMLSAAHQKSAEKKEPKAKL